jgi:hypothetical protein
LTFQTLEVLKRPAFAAIALATFTFFTVVFLYFDQFIFFSPYFVTNFSFSNSGLLILDFVIAFLSGVVISVSIFQAETVKLIKARNIAKTRIGVAGIAVAIFSGACPCYYLVPLLAFAGSAGGALATLGILLNSYEVPIKIASLLLLALVGYSLERSLRATCSVS